MARVTDPIGVERLLAGRPVGAYVDPERPVPLYRQVREFVEDAIVRGVYGHNRPLPSSRFLASTLGVSRNTVTLAYQELTALGFVESRPRSGFYAVTRTPEQTGRRERPSQLTVVAAAQERNSGRVDWGARLQQPADVGMPAAQDLHDWLSYPYPFTSAQPDLRGFPVRGWLRALTDAMTGTHLEYTLRDSPEEDDPLLVEALTQEVLPTRGVHVSPDQVIVTAGSQEALSLLAQVLVNESSIVGVENPGYFDAKRIFYRAGATLLPIPVDAGGAIVSQQDPYDLIYLTPSHHHPTNVTLSLRRRLALLELAQARDFLVIEDDYDAEFRFSGRPTPSLKSLDRAGRVVYVGSFSKFLAPGLRLGFVVADPELVASLQLYRHHATRHPPGLIQRALALFIKSGEYHKVLRTKRARLKRNWELVWEALAEEMPWTIDLRRVPPGGLSAWLVGPEELDGVDVWRRARAHGVIIDAGQRYYLEPDGPNNELRIGFSAINQLAIRPGIQVLGQAVAASLAGLPGTELTQARPRGLVSHGVLFAPQRPVAPRTWWQRRQA